MFASLNISNCTEENMLGWQVFFALIYLFDYLCSSDLGTILVALILGQLRQPL